MAVPADEFSQQLTAYREPIYRYVLSMARDAAEAEDLTQETLLRAHAKLSTLDDPAKLSSWLYRITTHYCLNVIRDRSRRRDLFRQHVVPEAKRDAGGPSSSDVIMLKWLLAHADERQAQAAVYVYMDGMSYQEAAEPLGVSKRTVGNLVQRFQTWARKFVAESGDLLETDGPDDGGRPS